MTDRERLSIIDYVKERFDHQDATLEDIVVRLESLESDRDQKRGRNQFLVNTGKTIAGAVATVLAALGIKSQIS